MKILLTITLTLLIARSSLAQADTIKTIDNEYSQYIYNDDTKSGNLSYNYSNKWDFDGDKQNDSLFFIGNGGAHAYFYPRIILSSDGLTRNFSTVQIDMPYFMPIETLKKWKTNSGVQFIVDDFDNDGVQDIYLNFNNPFGDIPKAWKIQGIKTKYVLLRFRGKKLSVKDYH